MQKKICKQKKLLIQQEIQLPEMQIILLHERTLKRMLLIQRKSELLVMKIAFFYKLRRIFFSNFKDFVIILSLTVEK